MRGIFTIGYEGARIEDFVATLRSVGVETVLDVRELPHLAPEGLLEISADCSP